ncbi:MAG: pyridoxamine 5'-phosphate oxidase family protein [Paludisphaera borealis]|uniref:pyridoxamine 5'-phosphate oxidase family protein n=1 Tax=Paludisphaera borealis TaxID=1387353 RepID=UPI00284DAE96|nr:pyridoxamine 5'-phosphate oxidase family protein [Paludisphaera borealis]MDR3619411.1 pyridoxamine 5'-phosphate oxidase family protein [Paludisphaera borealis]
MDTQTAAAAGVRKVALMIRGVKIAMLTTTAPDGTLHSRPMATQEAEFDGALWFFTKSGSGKVDEILHDSEVNVSYAAPEDHRYVSVSGKAALVRDRDKIEELWSPAYRPWFAQGLDDPDLALLRVDVRKVAYWDMLAGGMVTMPTEEDSDR